MEKKRIQTNGITYIEPVPDGTAEWYFGISLEQGDLYEAEELFKEGFPVTGNQLCLIHYPDGEVFWPAGKAPEASAAGGGEAAGLGVDGAACGNASGSAEAEAGGAALSAVGMYYGKPVFLEGQIWFPGVDFAGGVIRIFAFDCGSRETRVEAELPLNCVKNCYNLQLHTAPLCLTRQGDEGLFEVVWPERSRFRMDPHESFFLRDGDRLFFNKWHETGEGAEYRYWEDTVVRDLAGNVLETLTGDVRVMPDGTMWQIG